MLFPWFKYDRDWRLTTRQQLAELTPADCAVPAAAPRDPLEPTVRHYRFPAPPGISGRLLFFSDLHWRERDPAPAGRLIATINRLAPDWLLFGGDLISYLDYFPAGIQILNAMTARRAKLAVLGNWERWISWQPLDFWREQYAAAGFQLLINEFRDVAGEPLFLGFDDCRHGFPDIQKGLGTDANGRLVIGLMHSPETAGHTTGHFLGHLVLTGHTHAGQIRIPGFGALYTSTPYGKQFESGWYRRQSDGTWMLVTAGIGLTGAWLFRRRLFCPPEVVVIDLAPGTGWGK